MRIVLYAVAVLHVVWGLFALSRPEQAGEMLGLYADSFGAISELRATYGALFVVIGYLIFLAPTRPEGRAWILGLSWVYGGVIVGRVVSLIVDGYSTFTVGAAAFELVMSILLLLASRRVGQKPVGSDVS